MPFQLQVKLTGLCMFGIQKGTQSIVVVMPDARFRNDVPGSRVPMRHPDGEPAVPHVGYIRFNLANLEAPTSGVPSTNITTSPPYEIVHRFNRESLSFGLNQGTPDITNHGLRLPDFGEFAPVKQPVPTVFANNPMNTPDSVLMRTVLTGGHIKSAVKKGEDWYLTGELRPDGQRYDGKFSSDIEWIRDVDNADGLTLTISRFKPKAGEQPVVIKLRPTDVGGQRIIPLKIANLCSTNPMEWNDLEMKPVREPDKDFKWFYQLVQLRPELDPLRYPASAVPHPHPVKDAEAREGMLVNCWPSMIPL